MGTLSTTRAGEKFHASQTGHLCKNVTVFGSSNNEVLSRRLLHYPGALTHFHGNPCQSTINLKVRFGNKIHPIFNNYLLNFNHSRLLIIYLQDNQSSNTQDWIAKSDSGETVILSSIKLY